MTRISACVLCGDPDAKLTKQHLLRKAWRKQYPELNSLTSTYRIATPQGARTDDHRGDFFDLQVRSVCNPCNSEFLNNIETPVDAVIHRLFTTQTLTLTAAEAKALRRWAYVIALFRSLQDIESGANAPLEWFREFHESDGSVPPQVQVYFARVDSAAVVTKSRLTWHPVGGAYVRVLEYFLMVGATMIAVVAHDPSATLHARLHEAIETQRERSAGTFDFLAMRDVNLTGPLSYLDAATIFSPVDLMLSASSPLGPMDSELGTPPVARSWEIVQLIEAQGRHEPRPH